MTNWAAIKAEQATTDIKSTTEKTVNGDETVVVYGVSTAADQATGMYSDTIVYTATTH